MRILAIESSCDETATAIVDDGIVEVSSVVASSKDLHEYTGGIVPEVAARKQVEFVVPVLDQCLSLAAKKLGLSSSQEVVRTLDSLAVTVGPGLIGSLVVGVEAAKTLSLAWNLPLIPVNHLIGHIYANWLLGVPVEFPALVLVVSGGHTDLVLMKGHGVFEYIGGTLDDAAGEAFDKTARLLGLSKYLGGVTLSKVADASSDLTLAGKLPRSLIKEDNFDFSFSGLKTAVKRLSEEDIYSTDALAKEFQEAVVDVLCTKTLKAAREFNVSTILLAGGVSANRRLREELSARCDDKFNLVVPPINLCTDNAVYIGSAAFFNPKNVPLKDILANPSLTITD